MNALRTIAVVGLVLVTWLCPDSAAGAPGGSTVRLRTSAVVEQASEGVRLSQIADLEGEAALAMGEVIVLTARELAAGGGAWMRVDIGAVRRAMDSAGANWGRIAISGGRCMVRLGSAPVAAVGAAPAQAPEPVMEEVPVEAGAQTIKGHVADTLARLFGVERANIRLLFDPNDEDLLGQSEWGRRIVVQPVTTAGSARVLVDVRVFAGDRLAHSRRLSVEVEVRRRVVTMVKTVVRRAVIPADALSEAERWVAPSGPAPVESAGAAIGCIARTRLDAGSLLRVNELEASAVIRRNELATVHCLRAGFEIRTRARAQQDGAQGDVIEFTLEGSNRPFLARVDGPGIAVADLDQMNAAVRPSRKERAP